MGARKQKPEIAVKAPPAASLRKFVYWMEERQRIYLKRQSGEPYPWSKDPIFNQYRFCNVYREQDTVTRWLRENWREPYKDHKNLWFAMAMARVINWPDTLADIGFPTTWRPRHVFETMMRRRAQGLKVYTSAYMLCAPVIKPGEEKAHFTVFGVLDPLWRATRKNGPPWERLHNCSLEHATRWLEGFMGFGPFLAYETITDLRHTRYLKDAPDIYSWANAGPGACRGLNRLWGRPTRDRLSQRQACAEMRWLLDYSLMNADRRLLPTLEMRDIEMSLCEIDKYSRAQEAQATKVKTGLEMFRPPQRSLV